MPGRSCSSWCAISPRVYVSSGSGSGSVSGCGSGSGCSGGSPPPYRLLVPHAPQRCAALTTPQALPAPRRLWRSARGCGLVGVSAPRVGVPQVAAAREGPKGSSDIRERGIFGDGTTEITDLGLDLDLELQLRFERRLTGDEHSGRVLLALRRMGDRQVHRSLHSDNSHQEDQEDQDLRQDLHREDGRRWPAHVADDGSG